MSQLSLDELCKKCEIKCSRCLDTGKLWKPRGHWTAQLDGRGGFDLFRCPSCSDGHWFSCNHNSDIYEGGIKLFHYDDNSESLRRNYLIDMLTKIELKQQQVKEHLENERIKNTQIKNDEEHKIKENVEKQMNDGSDQPLYGESMDDTFSTITEHIHIQGELGKLIDKVSTAIQAYGGDLLSLASAVKDIKIDLDIKSEEEKIEKTKCCQSTKKDGFPVYLFLKVKIHNESSSCKLLEWCGCDSVVSKITVKYMVLFPKNKVAKKECDDGISAITGVKLDGIIAFLKQ
jgi:hypothetical protein